MAVAELTRSADVNGSGPHDKLTAIHKMKNVDGVEEAPAVDKPFGTLERTPMEHRNGVAQRAMRVTTATVRALMALAAVVLVVLVILTVDKMMSGSLSALTKFLR